MMKLLQSKQTILIASLFLSGFAFGQVGVNTSTPKTTFDINAKRDGSGTITDNTQIIGLQAPRLTRAELTANTATYGTNQNGALIYITDISGGDAASGTQRENITSLGYYYFDAAAASGSGRWVKMAVGNGGSTYTANNGLTMTGNNTKLGGTLIENTTIAQGNNSITFSGNSNVNITTTNALGYPLSIIHPLSGSISQPGLQIGGASGTAATGQAAFIGFNPNNSQGAWPISIGAQYISGSSGQGAADFFVATSSGAASDKKLVVKNNGNVGIGTTNPQNKLDIDGGNGNVLRLMNGGDLVYTADNDNSRGVATYCGTGNTSFSFVGFGTGASSATINLTTGAVTGSSDIRLKDHIKNIDSVSERLMKLRPVTYNYKTDPSVVVPGLIAQEVDTVFPDVVVHPETDKDYYSIYYQYFIPYIIKGFKEQQAEIEQLKKDHKELFELKVLVKNLQAEIEKLKKDK